MTPRELGFVFPAEWEKHDSTWLSYPHKEASWPGKIESIFPVYHQFIKILATQETVNINVNDQKTIDALSQTLNSLGATMTNIRLHLHPTNDAWCRDHGGAVVVNREKKTKAVVDWQYNAWGEKYPPHDLDNQIPQKMATVLNVPTFQPKIVMEGGSVDFNGQGTVLTTTSCLLNPNRNPHLSQTEIEQYLCDFYGVEQVLWLGDGIVGDDTDGHIDDLTRFTDPQTVVTVVETNKNDENYTPLQENLETLRTFKLHNGKPLRVVELPMPNPIWHEEMRLPASYANFYIANSAVIVPTFRCPQDQKALAILQQCFPKHKIIGLDSTDIVWGLGSFHCLSQQEPSLHLL